MSTSDCGWKVVSQQLVLTALQETTRELMADLGLKPQAGANRDLLALAQLTRGS